MATLNRAFLYVATAGDLCKVGITDEPRRRAKELSVTMVRVWKRPYCFQLEKQIKALLAASAICGSEWFAVDLAELLRVASRTVRIFDDEYAIEHGIEPSPRPGPNDPPYDPPDELPWLSSC